MPGAITSLASNIAQSAQPAPPTEMLAMLGMDNLQPAAGAQNNNAFAAVLTDAIQRVEAFQAGSENAISEFLSGGDVELHQVALSVQKAETSFELLAEVRNKVVQAYQEVMRMQV